MQDELKILDVKETTAMSGKKFWKISTDKGFYNCFEYSIADKLDLNKNKIVMADVLITGEGKFKSIKGLKEIEQREEKASNGNRDKLIVAQVSYKLAVELVNAGKWSDDGLSLHALAAKIYNEIFNLSKS